MPKGQRSFQPLILEEKKEARIRADDYLLFDRRKFTLSHLRKDERGRLRILRTPEGSARGRLGNHARSDESLIRLISLALLWNRLKIEVDEAQTNVDFLVLHLVRARIRTVINPEND